KWRELFFIFDGRKKCPRCEEKQFFTTDTKWRQGFAGVPLPFVPFVGQILNFSFPMILSSMLIIGLIIILIAPFSYEFTDKQQPLF
ncbi:TIGR04104 family putative zinc finger protein, partial [Caldalkalibacillus thermarum]|uniref:TIGR04104 family putative zinc finger protein n=1 Tax=Caldalkalibacillus thermarum TaxID=296745 RepID=UPI0009FF89D0